VQVVTDSDFVGFLVQIERYISKTGILITGVFYFRNHTGEGDFFIIERRPIGGYLLEALGLCEE